MPTKSPIPQMQATASTSNIASRSIRSPFAAGFHLNLRRPLSSIVVAIQRLKESWTSSGVRPYSRMASASESWQLACAVRPQPSSWKTRLQRWPTMSSSQVSAISRIPNIGRPRGAFVQMNSPFRGSNDWKLRVKPQSRNSLWSWRLNALKSTQVPPSACSLRSTSSGLDPCCARATTRLTRSSWVWWSWTAVIQRLEVHQRLALRTVDRDVCAVDEARTRRGQERNDVRYLLGGADASKRDAGHGQLVSALLRDALVAGERFFEPVPAVGVDRAGVDGVDAHAVAAVLLGR